MNKSKYNYSESDTYHSNLLDEYSSSKISEPEAQVITKSVDKKITKYNLNYNLIKHLRALKRYMLDPNVKWYRKSIVVAALIYFLTPIDTNPILHPSLVFSTI